MFLVGLLEQSNLCAVHQKGDHNAKRCSASKMYKGGCLIRGLKKEIKGAYQCKKKHNKN